MALDVVDQLVRSNAVDMVVVDSVAALVPRAELEGEMADMQMGLQARLMSKVIMSFPVENTAVDLERNGSDVGLDMTNTGVMLGANRKGGRIVLFFRIIEKLPPGFVYGHLEIRLVTHAG